MNAHREGLVLLSHHDLQQNGDHLLPGGDTRGRGAACRGGGTGEREREREERAVEYDKNVSSPTHIDWVIDC